MKILFNLISGQIFPNYFLIKHIKPDKCVNFYTEDTEFQNKIFKSILLNLYIDEVEVDAFDFNNCYNAVKEYVSKYSTDNLILNFTGGTKIMSNAAFCAFRDNNFKMIYLDSQNKKIVSIINDKVSKEDFNINTNVEEYFKLTDQYIVEDRPEPEPQKDASDRKNFRDYMEKNYKNISSLFIKLAVKSDSAKKKWRNENQKEESNGNQLIYTVSEKKYEVITKDGNKFILFGDDAFYYITGAWMENVVYEKIKKSEVFHDVKINFKLKWQDDKNKKNIKNEFDIVATKNHILHIFEVKSGSLNSDMILKLDSLNRFYGGLFSRSYIITYFDLENEYQDLLGRAKEYKINIIKLYELENYLKKI